MDLPTHASPLQLLLCCYQDLYLLDGCRMEGGAYGYNAHSIPWSGTVAMAESIVSCGFYVCWFFYASQRPTPGFTSVPISEGAPRRRHTTSKYLPGSMYNSRPVPGTCDMQAFFQSSAPYPTQQLVCKTKEEEIRWEGISYMYAAGG